MQKRKQRTSTRFRSQLAALEAVLVAPIVPGEARLFHESFEEVAERFTEAYQLDLDTHRETYDFILKRSPELAPRVEELRRTDAELRRGFLTLRATLRERREERAGDIDEARHRLIEWVGRCRSHEAAVLSWFMESAYREYGGGD